MKKMTLLALALVSIFSFIRCGGGGGNGSASTGSLSVSMTDATLADFQAVYVTVDAVEAHQANGEEWTTVVTPGKTVNLLDLMNGVREELGVAALLSGHYTQMRLILGNDPQQNSLNIFNQSHPYANYLIDDDGTLKELKVPSGMQTGIKIVCGFDINQNQTTELILDFDAAKSVVKAGSSGKWLLKPSIKVLDTANYSLVSGTVSYNSTALLEGVSVSAQIFNTLAVDPKDAVTVQAATLTDENGEFTLFLQPGAYNLVAFLGNENGAYGPACATVGTIQNSVTLQDFDLLYNALTGTLDAGVTIDEAAEFQHASVSIRQGAACNGGSEQIEVGSFNIAHEGNWAFHLPAGSYNVIGWTFERATQVIEDVDVTGGTTTTVDLSFPATP